MSVAEGVLLGCPLLTDKEGDSGIQLNPGLPHQVQDLHLALNAWPGIQVNLGLPHQLQDLHSALDALPGIQMNPGLYQQIQDSHLAVDAGLGIQVNPELHCTSSFRIVMWLWMRGVVLGL